MTRVGFDISQIAHVGGVATYTKNLAIELAKISELEMHFFYSSLRKPYQGELKNVSKFKIPPTLFEKLFNSWRFLSIEKFVGDIDVFHSSDWVQPKSRAKKVTTYHDVVALKYPKWSTPKIVSVNRRRLALVEKEIDMVIAVSESTKKDLMFVSKIPENKIVVIHEAADSQFKPQSDKEVAKFKQIYQLPEKFVLAIGGVGERRNLEAVKLACRELDLVILGKTHHFAWEELPLLYASAQLLLYPSFYEGFGLPILEAMSVGVPVITSNVSAMPEVGGEAAIYVDPKNVKEIKDRVTELMNDQKLRQELIKKGLARVEKFSWQIAAAKTAMVYTSLSNDH